MKDKELATALGISGAMVSKLKQRGMPTHSVEAAQQWRLAYLQPGRTKTARADATFMDDGAEALRPPAAAPLATPGVEPYLASRARREAAEAALAEMKLREQSGELVRSAAVTAAYAVRLTYLRDALLQLPARLAPSFAVETDQQAIDRQLFDELARILREAANADIPAPGPSWSRTICQHCAVPA